MEFLSSEYWNTRYEEKDTGWDLNEVSPPIKNYIDQLTIDVTSKILIPGCGSAHEATYLISKGFTNIHILDFAQDPLNKFKLKHPYFPTSHLHGEDFFIHNGKYDLIIEQTLFCAIDPNSRTLYAKKCSDLLNEGGRLVGLLFNRSFPAGPPFGGSRDEYFQYFSSYFSEIYMEPCFNSIAPRSGTELFIKMKK